MIKGTFEWLDFCNDWIIHKQFRPIEIYAPNATFIEANHSFLIIHCFSLSAESQFEPRRHCLCGNEYRWGRAIRICLPGRYSGRRSSILYRQRLGCRLRRFLPRRTDRYMGGALTRDIEGDHRTVHRIVLSFRPWVIRYSLTRDQRPFRHSLPP